MSNIIPTKIYLQYDPDGETTWCADKINDDDIEYVLANSEPCFYCDKQGAMYVGSIWLNGERVSKLFCNKEHMDYAQMSAEG